MYRVRLQFGQVKKRHKLIGSVKVETDRPEVLSYNKFVEGDLDLSEDNLVQLCYVVMSMQ